MNSDQPQSDVPGLDEDLVAYLDGELDDATSRRLEERLNNDESARQRLRALATSWDLLDHLPRAASDDNFTRTTVELIALEARKDVEAEQAAVPTRNRRRWMLGIGAGLAAVMIGFVAVVLAWPDENERLLRDLPIVQNYELYNVTPATGGVEFLRRLEREELFIGDVAEDNATSESSAEADNAESLTREALAARRAEVEALSPEKKNELRKAYERFKAEPKEEQERFREFDADLRDTTDEARLRAVLASYHNWLPTLSPLERANLLKMSSENAIAEIQRLKQEQLARFARSGGSSQGPLSITDVEKIERWLQEWAMKRQGEILAKATPEQQKWFSELSEEAKRRSLVFLAGPKPPDLKSEEWESLLSQLPTVKQLFETNGKQPAADKLLQQFPFDVKERIKTAVARAATLEEKRNLLFGWYHRGQWARDAFAGGVSKQELDRFFREELSGKLSDKEREELVSLPPEEFNKKLRFLYHVHKELPPGHFRGFGKRGWGRGRGEGRGPDGGGRGGFGPSFGPGGRGGPPDFDADHKKRRDREGSHEHNDRDRRRGPESDDQRDSSTERRQSSNKDE